MISTIMANSWWKHRQQLLFSFSHTFFSSLGQTFFIAFLVPFFQLNYHLSDQKMGALFGCVTILSALCIPTIGGLIDRVNLKNYSFAVLIVLVSSVTLLSSVPPFWLFAPALFLTRLCGQGLFSHIGSTSTVRYFSSNRGRALSIISTGLPLAESLVPLAFIAISQMYSWQTALQVLAASALICLCGIYLISPKKSHPFFHPASIENVASKGTLKFRDLASNPLFWRISTQFWIPPMLITGLYFHKVSVGEANNWSQSLLAQALTAAAICRVAATLIIGQMIDKLSACRCLKFMLIPMHLSLVMLTISDHWIHAYIYMGLTGFAAGFSSTLYSAIWAEIYGVENIGRIKAINHQFAIFSTAITPPILGALLDQGIQLNIQVGIMLTISILVHTLVITPNTSKILHKYGQSPAIE